MQIFSEKVSCYLSFPASESLSNDRAPDLKGLMDFIWHIPFPEDKEALYKPTENEEEHLGEQLCSISVHPYLFHEQP